MPRPGRRRSTMAVAVSGWVSPTAPAAPDDGGGVPDPGGDPPDDPRGPPVVAARQRHGGGHQDAADQHRVQGDGGGQADDRTPVVGHRVQHRDAGHRLHRLGPGAGHQPVEDRSRAEQARTQLDGPQREHPPVVPAAPSAQTAQTAQTAREGPLTRQGQPGTIDAEEPTPDLTTRELQHAIIVVRPAGACPAPRCACSAQECAPSDKTLTVRTALLDAWAVDGTMLWSRWSP